MSGESKRKTVNLINTNKPTSKYFSVELRGSDR
jgi:hypothetical protein